MERKMLIVLVAINILLMCVNGLFESNWNASHTKDDIGINVYQKGNITYLTFENRNGLCTVNYTSDSMEWEFLHQPTKTTTNGYSSNYHWTYDSDSIIQVR